MVGGWLESIGAAPAQSLVLTASVTGVRRVIGFIPQLIVLFILAGFEGCGYRSAMRRLHWHRVFAASVCPANSSCVLIAAGVPAVMATKTIENEKDRRMTIMTTTMIPCGAKLPIIALVFGALAVGDYEATCWVAPVFYFLGLFAIILSCIILKKFRAFSGEVAPFIMELPQYHLPTVKNVLLSMWERVRSYVVKAGTIIFLSSMVIWFLLNFGLRGSFGLLDPEVDDYIQYSLMAGPQPARLDLRAARLRQLGIYRHLHHGPCGQGECRGHRGRHHEPRRGNRRDRPVAVGLVCRHARRQLGGHHGLLRLQSFVCAVLRGHRHYPSPDDVGEVDLGRHRLHVRLRLVRGAHDLPVRRPYRREIAFGPFTALAVVVAAGMLYLLFRPAAKPKGAGKLEAASKNA